MCLRSEHRPLTPPSNPQQKTPRGTGRWSILWGKLDPGHTGVNARIPTLKGGPQGTRHSTRHFPHTFQRQPVDGVPWRVSHARRATIPTHDRDALARPATQREPVYDHRQPAQSAGAERADYPIDGGTRPVDEGDRAPAIVDAVEVHHGRVAQQV